MSFLGPLDHVGVAVRDLEGTTKAYVDAGLEVVWRGEVGEHRVKVVFLKKGGHAMVELLEPTDGDSPLGRFLSRRGPGLHHLSFLVNNIDESLAQAKRQGYELVDTLPTPGAMGRRVAFLHPRSFNGVLVELVENR